MIIFLTFLGLLFPAILLASESSECPHFKDPNFTVEDELFIMAELEQIGHTEKGQNKPIKYKDNKGQT